MIEIPSTSNKLNKLNRSNRPNSDTKIEFCHNTRNSHADLNLLPINPEGKFDQSYLLLNPDKAILFP
jgi:hypothetical protein